VSAPFHSELAEAPIGGRVVWREAHDGVRLRLGLWTGSKPRGTILLLPGRTEFIEKYGRVISTLNENEYAVAVIDWRGQGYSDRLSGDPAIGHVGAFSDYQFDLNALVEEAEEAGLPRPWHVLGHSMGGNIGLRALVQGLEVQRVVFSAPMWGILVPTSKKLMASVLPKLAQVSGRHLEYLPGSTESAYVTENGFEDNLLTTDKDHFDYFTRLAHAAPEFALGGPSIHWFGEAQAECTALLRAPRPTLPVLTCYGSLEGIVDRSAIHKMHDGWPSATVTEIDGARHELMMEADPARTAFFDRAHAFFDAG
jgi:lysophospholipase